ncbi:MAG: isoprenylcysteine carboxylmethyltransferase family protein [Prevotellaceae bacterium]|jgi:protein-S-isoprenylcysteine O-methyltransferase Ste14|nr:isoprenylcysteine carboxylmethyltransferase family protein [Prevotellaceae bacterium]
MNYLQQYFPHLNTEEYSAFFLCANVIIAICVTIVVFSVIIDFIKYHQPGQHKKKTRSGVETGTMFLYFFFYYILLRVRFGRINFSSPVLADVLIFAGIILVVSGSWVNVSGRLALKQNWANQVTIYHHQQFISHGAYKWVRHPLYASLIWMFCGAAMVYGSWLAFLSVFAVFVPMMIYRAKQEEKLLREEFSEYADYQIKTGMLFPKFFKL